VKVYGKVEGNATNTALLNLLVPLLPVVGFACM
jgi:hypothetical protein